MGCFLEELIGNASLALQTICIVGAGLSGIEAAKIFGEGGRRHVVLFEKSGVCGGIWARAANDESRVQVDPISFAPIEDEKPVRVPDASLVFDNMALPRAEVLQRLLKDAASLKVQFNAEVVDFVTKPTTVEIKVKHMGVVHTLEVAQLHIRTGCLQDPVKPSFAASRNVGPRLVHGVGNDIAVQDFRGKRVVIVGLGAFAVENVKRALQGEAASITIVARSFKPLFPGVCECLDKDVVFIC